MGDELTFYFDFASPYAYAAFDEAIRIAGAARRKLRLRPVLVWVILKQQGITSPLETPARREYLLGDMARSAAFHGLPFRQPDPLPISAHRAARMWLGLAGDCPERGATLARAIFAARFAEGRDIREPDLLLDIAERCGHSRSDAAAQFDVERPRQLLEGSTDEAIGNGAPGIPYFMLDGEGFFGADRLPHLRWRLGLRPFDPGENSRENLR